MWLAQRRKRRPRGVGRNPASASAWARGVSYTPVPSARSTVRRPSAPPRTASASPAAAGTSISGSLVHDSSVLPPRSTYSTRFPPDSTTRAPALRPGRCAPGTSPGRAGQGSAEPNAFAGSAAASTVMGGPAFPASPAAPSLPRPPLLHAFPEAPWVLVGGGGSPGQSGRCPSAALPPAPGSGRSAPGSGPPAPGSGSPGPAPPGTLLLSAPVPYPDSLSAPPSCAPQLPTPPLYALPLYLLPLYLLPLYPLPL